MFGQELDKAHINCYRKVDSHEYVMNTTMNIGMISSTGATYVAATKLNVYQLTK